jgi:ribosomal protein S14
MKKLIEKEKRLRKKIKTNEKLIFILKSIKKNSNFSVLLRWNATKTQNRFSKIASITALNARCVSTINRKKFNKLTNFSRYVFLKLIRKGELHGFKKSSW